MTQAVLFDLDGTLADTALDLGGALNTLLQLNPQTSGVIAASAAGAGAEGGGVAATAASAWPNACAARSPTSRLIATNVMRSASPPASASSPPIFPWSAWGVIRRRSLPAPTSCSIARRAPAATASSLTNSRARRWSPERAATTRHVS